MGNENSKDASKSSVPTETDQHQVRGGKSKGTNDETKLIINNELPSPSISSEEATETDQNQTIVSVITGRTQPISPSFKAGWHIHLRPTWNTSFGTAVGVLRATANHLPRDIQTIRFVTDTR